MKRFAVVVIGLSLTIGIGLMVFGQIGTIRFEQNCKGYLKRAADANTVELAAGELEKAITFLETNGLTDGDTSIIYSTPKCELNFWYANLRASLNELHELSSDSDQLTVSTHLLKLRESIMDNGEKGPRVTLPPNIHVYPNHRVYRLAGATAMTGMMGGLMLLAVAEERNRKLSCTSA